MPDLTHIHPMIVHFPIAMLIFGFFSEAIGLIFKKKLFSDAAFLLVVAGALGAIAAYISGSETAGELIEAGSLKQAVETHEGAAMMALWLSVGAAVLRTFTQFGKKYMRVMRPVAFLFLFVAALAVARAGYYGGELVFKHAAGVTLQLGD